MDEKVELLNETLLNIYRNYIPKKKKIKCNYRQPLCMTDNIKNSLKDRSKLTKIFYKNGQRKTDREKVLEKATECTNEILEAKKNYILKMSNTLEDSHNAPKTYWTILNRLIYNKKFLEYRLYLLMVTLFQFFVRKQTFLLTTLHQYVHQ